MTVTQAQSLFSNKGYSVNCTYSTQYSLVYTVHNSVQYTTLQFRVHPIHNTF